MFRKVARLTLGGIIVAFAGSIAFAQAAVIVGETVGDTTTYPVVGLEFTALTNTDLVSFTFANQGLGDKIVLTDAEGDVLDQIFTPPGVPSYTAYGIWPLTAGDSYFLLKTIGANGLYGTFEQPLPSNSDLAVIWSGTFGDTIADAISAGYGKNAYWTSFSSITTFDAPEPSTWAMMLLGFSGLGFAGARASRRAAAAAGNLRAHLAAR